MWIRFLAINHHSWHFEGKVECFAFVRADQLCYFLMLFFDDVIIVDNNCWDKFDVQTVSSSTMSHFGIVHHYAT